MLCRHRPVSSGGAPIRGRQQAQGRFGQVFHKGLLFIATLLIPGVHRKPCQGPRLLEGLRLCLENGMEVGELFLSQGSEGQKL